MLKQQEELELQKLRLDYEQKRARLALKMQENELELKTEMMVINEKAKAWSDHDRDSCVDPEDTYRDSVVVCQGPGDTAFVGSSPLRPCSPMYQQPDVHSAAAAFLENTQPLPGSYVQGLQHPLYECERDVCNIDTAVRGDTQHYAPLYHYSSSQEQPRCRPIEQHMPESTTDVLGRLADLLSNRCEDLPKKEIRIMQG